jgi:hypothetical protein
MPYPKEFSLERVSRGVIWGFTPTLLLGFWLGAGPFGGHPSSVDKTAIGEGSAPPGVTSDASPAPPDLVFASQEASRP